jgi:hypothetical protein
MARTPSIPPAANVPINMGTLAEPESLGAGVGVGVGTTGVAVGVGVGDAALISINVPESHGRT